MNIMMVIDVFVVLVKGYVGFEFDIDIILCDFLFLNFCL